MKMREVKRIHSSGLTVDSGSGLCFICLNKILPHQYHDPSVNLTVKDPGSDKPSPAAAPPPIFKCFQYLARYLKMDIGKVIIGKGSTPPDLLAAKNVSRSRSRLMVELCEDCASLTEDCSKLWRELERIQIQAKSCLLFIHQKMVKANGTDDEKKTDDPEAGDNARLFEALRREAFQKCSHKLRSDNLPRIPLRSLKRQEVDRGKSNLQAMSKPSQLNINGHDDDRRQPRPPNFDNPLELLRGPLKLNASVEPRVRIQKLSMKDINKNMKRRTTLRFKSKSGLIKVPGDKHIKMEGPDDEALSSISNTGNQYPDDSMDDNFEPSHDHHDNDDNGEDVAPPPTVEKVIMKSEVDNKQLMMNPKVNPKSGKYECPDPDCSKQFRTKSGAQWHYEGVHLHIRYKCLPCGIEFTFQRNYSRHQLRKHGIKIKLKSLHRSNKAMPKKKKPKIRQKIKPEVDETISRLDPKSGKHECLICSKQYIYKKGVKDHHKKAHQLANANDSSKKDNEDDNPYKGSSTYNPETGRRRCSVCSKEFHKKYFREHYRSAHLGLKRQCEKCGRAFTLISNMRQHRKRCGLRKSEGQKKKICSCEICGQGFTRARNMVLHMKTIHSQIRAHSCELCGKAYKRKSQLAYHRKKDCSGKGNKSKVKQLRTRRKPPPPPKPSGDSEDSEGLPDADIENSPSSPPPEPDPVEIDNDDVKTEVKQPKRKSPPRQASFSLIHQSQCEMSFEVTPETGAFKCNLCSEEFGSRYLFVSHHNRVHRRRRYRCNLCGKEFNQHGNYMSHQRVAHKQQKEKGTSHDDPEIPKVKKVTKPRRRKVKVKATPKTSPSSKEIQCSFCEVSVTSGELSNHLATAHYDPTQAKSEGGGPEETFVVISRFPADKPLSSVIPETGKFKCALCPEEFRTERNVQNHLRYFHYSVKYRCTLCEKEISRPDRVKKHYQTVHVNDEVDINIDGTGKTPPSYLCNCQICGKGFSQFRYLQGHHKYTHLREQYKKLNEYST